MGVARRLCRHPYAVGSPALLIVVIVGGTLALSRPWRSTAGAQGSVPVPPQLTQFEGQVERDQALLDNARLDLKRFQGLVTTDAVPRQQLDTQNDQGQIEATQQDKAGTVSYLNVITVQTIALTDEITAIQIRGRRMAAAVLLVQALGGGWTAVELPSSADVMKRDDPAPRAP